MSIKLMSAVWERLELDPYERLVLLSLADHADDDGLCYPSVARLCQRTGMKERGVQTVVKRLAAKGLITIDPNAGRRGANLYTIRATPAPDAPPHGMPPAPDAPTPAPDAPHPRTPCGGTPAPGAPEPSSNRHRTVRNRHRARACALPPDWVLSDRNIEDAEKAGLTAEEIEHEATTFRDHHLAKGSRFVDWAAAWRTWLQRYRRFGRAGPSAGRPQSGRGGSPGGLVGAAMRSRARHED